MSNNQLRDAHVRFRVKVRVRVSASVSASVSISVTLSVRVREVKEVREVSGKWAGMPLFRICVGWFSPALNVRRLPGCHAIRLS